MMRPGLHALDWKTLETSEHYKYDARHRDPASFTRMKLTSISLILALSVLSCKAACCYYGLTCDIAPEHRLYSSPRGFLDKTHSGSVIRDDAVACCCFANACEDCDWIVSWSMREDSKVQILTCQSADTQESWLHTQVYHYEFPHNNLAGRKKEHQIADTLTFNWRMAMLSTFQEGDGR